jgi:cbb3-type cytochrome oxidase subunit 3
MTFFIFAGDMLVMLFMFVLVVWVFWRSTDATINQSARIPLEDERSDG